MRTFKHPNLEDFECPICGSSEDKEVMLVPIEGTQEGFNAQAIQVHTECLQEELWFNADYKIFYTKKI